MSEIKYVPEPETHNKGSVKYHYDTDCPNSGDNLVKMSDEYERLNIVACAVCADGLDAKSLRGKLNE